LTCATRTGALKGGDGGPAVSPGSPEKSLLWVLVAGDRMPPGKEKLTSAQKTLFAQLDRAGGQVVPTSPLCPPVSPITDADRSFWSFRPPVRPLGDRNPSRRPRTQPD